MHFNKGVDFDGIYEVVNYNRETIKDKRIIDVNGTKIFYDVNTEMVGVSLMMITNQNEYVIDEMIGALFEDFSCKFIIRE